MHLPQLTPGQALPRAGYRGAGGGRRAVLLSVCSLWGFLSTSFSCEHHPSNLLHSGTSSSLAAPASDWHFAQLASFCTVSETAEPISSFPLTKTPSQADPLLRGLSFSSWAPLLSFYLFPFAHSTLQVLFTSCCNYLGDTLNHSFSLLSNFILS